MGGLLLRGRARAGKRCGSVVETGRKNAGALAVKDRIVKLSALVPGSGGGVEVLTPGHVEDYHV
jgi:hypothetical protein